MIKQLNLVCKKTWFAKLVLVGTRMLWLVSIFSKTDNLQFGKLYISFGV